jgi:hypothetical protein
MTNNNAGGNKQQIQPCWPNSGLAEQWNSMTKENRTPQNDLTNPTMTKENRHPKGHNKSNDGNNSAFQV